MKAVVKSSTGKASHSRGFGHSVNRWTLRIEIFCAHPLPESPLLVIRKIALRRISRNSLADIFFQIPCFFLLLLLWSVLL